MKVFPTIFRKFATKKALFSALLEYFYKKEGRGSQLLNPCDPESEEVGTEFTKEANKVASVWEAHHPLALSHMHIPAA